LGQGCRGELAPPAFESRGRQRTALLTEGDGIHVEAAVWCPQEDLTWVEPTPRTRGCAWHDDDHWTGSIDGITTDDDHRPEPGLLRALRRIKASVVRTMCVGIAGLLVRVMNTMMTSMM